MSRSALAGAVALATASAVGAQSTASIGPFIAYQPGVASSSTFGLSFVTGRPPLGFRGGAFASLDDNALSARGWRPWGADADALLSLSSGLRLTGPYVFAGVGVNGRDSLGTMTVDPGWSYGAGFVLPLGRFDLSAETRTRMTDFAWPGNPGSASPRREIRLGAALHFAGLGRSASPTSRGSSTGRSRMPGGGAESGAAASRIPGPVRIPSGASGASSAARVLPTAERYVGTKYVWGGSSPTTGFDCSGFTKYVFARHSVELPRTSRQQAQAGSRLPADWRSLVPGDLVMFAESGEAISHVAIYAGDNRIIHSTSSGGGVRYDDLTTRRGQWFAEHIVAARRVTPDGRGLMLDFAKAFAGIVESYDPPDKAPPPGK
jgi:cell wall-associated NlpC family hydrolase